MKNFKLVSLEGLKIAAQYSKSYADQRCSENRPMFPDMDSMTPVRTVEYDVGKEQAGNWLVILETPAKDDEYPGGPTPSRAVFRVAFSGTDGGGYVQDGIMDFVVVRGRFHGEISAFILNKAYDPNHMGFYKVVMMRYLNDSTDDNGRKHFLAGQYFHFPVHVKIDIFDEGVDMRWPENKKLPATITDESNLTIAYMTPNKNVAYLGTSLQWNVSHADYATTATTATTAKGISQYLQKDIYGSILCKSLAGASIGNVMYKTEDNRIASTAYCTTIASTYYQIDMTYPLLFCRRTVTSALNNGDALAQKCEGTLSGIYTLINTPSSVGENVWMEFVHGTNGQVFATNRIFFGKIGQSEFGVIWYKIGHALSVSSPRRILFDSVNSHFMSLNGLGKLIEIDGIPINA